MWSMTSQDVFIILTNTENKKMAIRRSAIIRIVEEQNNCIIVMNDQCSATIKGTFNEIIEQIFPKN